MTADLKFIRFERDDEGIGVLMLNRPEVLNALNTPMLEEIQHVLEGARLDLSLKVLVIKGEGPTFCSGFDLREYRETLCDDRARGDASRIMFDELRLQQFSPIREVFRLLWESPVVSIAQVQGYCVESALAVAMMCDLVIAADDARFFWRTIGGGGPAWHLWPWTIGLRKTKELLFAVEYVTGEEAAQMGMINKSVPVEELDGEVKRWARKVARREREFLCLDKMATNKAFEMMGLFSALDNAVLAHLLSHLTEPSRALEGKARGGTAGQFRESLEARASATDRDILE
ncbi:MAG: enoyl-CoA hydratase/isomerase family protein [Chloroflexi bacterium]|nr:enoyl-CoA hydratase/isomerase family protein [Chloroflexota bacterium]